MINIEFWKQFADINNIDVEVFINDYNRLNKLIIDHYREFKDVRDYIQIGLQYNNTRWHEDIYNILYKYIKSDPFNIVISSIMKILGKRTLDIQYVRRTYLLDNKLPPAFDESIRADRNQHILGIINDIFDGNSNIMDDFKISCDIVNSIRQFNHNNRSKHITLSNGTSTGIQIAGLGDLSDIEGIITCNINDNIYDKCHNIIEYFNIDIKDEYITFKSNNHGRHLVIPDKDGKIREIYNLNPDVQYISKNIDEAIKNVIRNLEGNYTERQYQWIDNVINKGWNRDKLIITTDMSKYSDTLDRNLIMRLLNWLGIPLEVTYEISRLYSLPVIDIDNKLLDNTSATYQGQYGDFSLITLVNLFNQNLVYKLLNEPLKEGYIAAVGDDTGNIFEPQEDTIAQQDRNIQMIIDVYSAWGVNINKSKTATLNKGDGYADFCKRFITSSGIVHYVNPKSIDSEYLDDKIDEIKRWRADGFHNTKLEQLLLGKYYNNFDDLHILNGGLNDRAITREDVKLFIYKNSILSIENKSYSDTIYKNLDKICNSDADLRNTLLSHWCSNTDITNLDRVNANKYIRDTVTKHLKYGYISNIVGLDQIVGMKYEMIEYLLPELYKQINEVMERISIRERNNKSKRRRKEIYRKLFEIDINQVDYNSNDVIRILHTEELDQQVKKVLADRIIKRSDVFYRKAFGKGGYYCNINGNIYRLYRVWYTSGYEFAPKDWILNAIKPYLNNWESINKEQLYQYIIEQCLYWE